MSKSKTFTTLRDDLDKLYLYASSRGRILFKVLPFSVAESYRYVLSYYPELECDIEDEIWDECVIEHSFDYHHEDLLAGTITVLAKVVLELSTPKDENDFFETLAIARDDVTSNAKKQISAVIAKVFPSYTIEDIERMPWNTMLERLAQAEYVTGKQLDLSKKKDDSSQVLKRLDEYTSILDIEKINSQDNM